VAYLKPTACFSATRAVIALAGVICDEVLLAWQCYQRVRAAYQAKKPADGKAVAENIVATFPTCPIRQITRLGKTQWS
jgi:hypothetical protein